MIRIAIVENEERDYLVLKEFLDRFSRDKNVQFETEYFQDAVDFVSDYHYNFDLIFFDIMMPDIDGMDAAKRIRKVDTGVTIIFVTNMAQYAIQGYNVSAHYFILKPVVYKDFAVKLEETLVHIEREKKNEFLILDMPYEKRKVFTKEIKYIEIFSHNVVFHLIDKELQVRGTLSEFEKKLDSKKFCRINSCYIVNLDFITAVKDMSVFIEETELRISYMRKKVLMKAFADYVASGAGN